MTFGCSENAPTSESATAQPRADAMSRYGGPEERAGEDRILPTAGAPAPVPPAPKPTERLPSGAACVTAACHGTFATAPHIHGPVSANACAACHDDDTGAHTFPLKREGIALCTFCHPVVGRKSNLHQAVSESGCTACHRPHISDTKFLLTAKTVEAVCVRCHEMERKRYAHAPFASGACTACHDPHESDTQALLRGGDGPDHCFMCHRTLAYTIANAPTVHAPVLESCTTCHRPHSSDFDHQLNRPIEEVCFCCHTELEAQVTQARAPHAAVFTADRCANCHDPHAAGRPKLLRDRVDRLCLHCHDHPIQADDGHTIPDMRPALTARRYLHGPVKFGECNACHNAHGAGHARLLRDTFPESFYAAFSLQNYALCFRCHDKSLVLEPETTSLTDFRDGAVNLHYLHVHRAEKGRTCKACHAIHGSDQPKHMATAVPFEGSQWSMPIRFEKTADGGRCAPGCHKPMAYSRDRRRATASSPTSRGTQ